MNQRPAVVSLQLSLLFVFFLFCRSQAASTTLSSPPQRHCFSFPASQLDKFDVNVNGNHYGTKTRYLDARQAIRRTFNVTWPDGLNTNTKTKDQQCQAVNLFFISRHTARYPSTKLIRMLSALMPLVQKQLVSPQNKRLSQEQKNEFLHWKWLIHPTEENRVTAAGRYETEIIARIMYQYFPGLLDIHKNHFDVGVSAKIRTTETAQAFIRGLVEFQVRQDDLSFEQSSELINEMIKKKFPIRYEPVTMAHRRCKGDGQGESPAYESLQQTATYRNLSSAFRIRHGLHDEVNDLSVVMAIYQTCIFEGANYGHSAWCDLFHPEEMRALEYLEEVNDYHDAYVPETHRELACVVMTELYRRVNAVVRNPTAPSNTTLFFSHEGLMSKLVSHLGLFQWFGSPGLDHTTGRVCVASGSARNWYSSLVVPFNANFAAVLHRCGKGDRFKLLTLFNEIPVVIPGCASELCDIEDFKRYYGDQAYQRACDLDKICGQKSPK